MKTNKIVFIGLFLFFVYCITASVVKAQHSDLGGGPGGYDLQEAFTGVLGSPLYANGYCIYYDPDDDSGVCAPVDDTVNYYVNGAIDMVLTANQLQCSSGTDFDLNGNQLEITTSGDEQIDGSVDNQILFRVGGNVVAGIQAGSFTAQAGTTIYADTIDDTTAGNGTSFTSLITLLNNGLHILDTNASHDLVITGGSNLTSDRALTVNTGDAATAITLEGTACVCSQDMSSDATPTWTGAHFSAGAVDNVSMIYQPIQTSDAAATMLKLRAGNAYGQAVTNRAGATLKLYQGNGAQTLTVTNFALCAGDTVSAFVDGVKTTGTEPTQWNDDGGSNNSVATSLAAWLDGLSGVAATAVAAVVYVTPEETAGSVLILSNSDCITDAHYAGGSVEIPTNGGLYNIVIGDGLAVNAAATALESTTATPLALLSAGGDFQVGQAINSTALRGIYANGLYIQNTKGGTSYFATGSGGTTLYGVNLIWSTFTKLLGVNDGGLRISNNAITTDICLYTGGTDSVLQIAQGDCTTFQGSVLETSIRSTAADVDTVAASGDGNPAAYMLLPTSSHVSVTCNDTDNCTGTLSETGARNAQELRVVNVGTNTVAFADSAGVQEMTGGTTCTLGQGDMVFFIYSTPLTTWLQAGPCVDN